MSRYVFNVYETTSDYFSTGSGSVVDSDLLTINDADDFLHATSASDPGGDQSFSFADESAVVSYNVAYLDLAQLNGAGASFEIYAMQVSFVSGPNKYYVLSKDSGFTPTNGDALAITSFSSFTSTDYLTLGPLACFVSGTRILTPSGQRRVEALKTGDLVVTADHGPQPIRWISKRNLDQDTLSRNPHYQPILIRAGSGCNPNSPLFVSPQHRMVLETTDGREWMVPAKVISEEIPRMARIARGKRQVCYLHLLFDRHEVIFAEGAATESMYLGPQGLCGMGRAAQQEICDLFPGALLQCLLAQVSHQKGTARPLLPRGQVRRFSKKGLLAVEPTNVCA